MTPKQLKAIRLQAGLTQTQLAKLFALSSQTRISEFENGKEKPSKRILLLYKLLEEGKLTIK